MIRQSELLFFLAVAAGSAALVGLVRRLVIAHGVIDHPSERSSHAIPTPRGGGLGAIVAIVIAFFAIDGTMRDGVILLCIAGCLCVSAVGWFDDQRGLPVASRLVIHVLGGITVGLLSLRPGTPTLLVVAAFAWWTFWTVSSINIVNFMDGINGLVASQIAIFAGSLMLFGWSAGAASWYAAAVAAGTLGFLPWNFPRARIFLGDAGSGALGFLVPVIALLAMREHGIDVVQAHLPLVGLFGDATVTILRRWRRGEPLTKAHRSHLYQRLANDWMGHARVTLLYGAAGIVGAIVAHLQARPHGWLLVLVYLAALCLIAVVLERQLARRANSAVTA